MQGNTYTFNGQILLQIKEQVVLSDRPGELEQHEEHSVLFNNLLHEILTLKAVSRRDEVS